MAIVVAYLMTAKEIKGKTIIETMLMLPLVLHYKLQRLLDFYIIISEIIV